MPSINKDPVLVAGAGPAGCAVALYLAQRGIAVTVVESEESLPLDLRASTFHQPTLDLLDSLGVTERLIAEGLIAPHYQYRDRRTGEAAIFSLSIIADLTRHPYRLQCEQYKFTQAAVDMLVAYPHARVLFGHRLEQLEQDSDGVTIQVETAQGGFKSLRGSYLVGADGANSRVRKALAINFEGFTYSERFLVVSTPFDFPEAIPGLSLVNYVSDPQEWCVVLKTPTLWRVLFPTDPDASESVLLSDGFIDDRLRHLTSRPGPFDVKHRTLYRVHQRVAAKWRSGRALLAGDACHINNPLGGMGMPGGLHDAFSLAEKLLAILNGVGDETLLDLYERQRRGICLQFVQEHTINNKKLMEGSRWRRSLYRDRIAWREPGYSSMRRFTTGSSTDWSRSSAQCARREGATLDADGDRPRGDFRTRHDGPRVRHAGPRLGGGPCERHSLRVVWQHLDARPVDRTSPGQPDPGRAGVDPLPWRRCQQHSLRRLQAIRLGP
jgi:3-(3-hydroxy-phenyl)propionate hydroxylase